MITSSPFALLIMYIRLGQTNSNAMLLLFFSAFCPGPRVQINQKTRKCTVRTSQIPPLPMENELNLSLFRLRVMLWTAKCYARDINTTPSKSVPLSLSILRLCFQKVCRISIPKIPSLCTGFQKCLTVTAKFTRSKLFRCAKSGRIV